GHIPSTLGRLVHLTQLDLSFNQLSGNIPSEVRTTVATASRGTSTLGSVFALRPRTTHALYIRGNYWCDHPRPLFPQRRCLSPTQLSNARALEVLSLCNNVLIGPVPESFGGLTNLKVLNASNNKLAG
ncbi:unnamed protein product, partial [Ectocarpus sp. 12 AP-2014]